MGTHSRLTKYFDSLGVYHPDNVESIIFTSYYRRLTGQEIRLEEQIKYYRDYWKNAKRRAKAEEKAKRKGPYAVQGEILNSKGEPFPGVAITVKGTSISTITDAEGKFRLDRVPRNAQIIITHAGMQTFKFIVREATNIIVQLKNRLP